MGKQMNQQKGLLKNGVTWFRSQIKRIFHKGQSQEKNHLEELYERYERQNRTLQKRGSGRARARPKDRGQILQVVLKKLRGEQGLQQKYQERRNKIKDFLEGQAVYEKHSDLVCSICMEYFINPVPTVCGHTFCYLCIENALLVKGLCPLCRTYLRGYELSPCQATNNIVKLHVKKSGTATEIQSYNSRLIFTEEWQKQRKIPPQRYLVGQRLDVRDTQYIWCKGFIMNVYRKGERVTELLIHYQGWNKIYDEILDVASPRLAPLGFYTTRQDIPRYALNQNHETYYSYVVTGPVPPQPQPQPPAGENQSDMEEEQQLEQPNELSEVQEEAEQLEQRIDNMANDINNIGINVNEFQQRIMLRNLLSEMGLSSLGNHINIQEVGLGNQIEEERPYQVENEEFQSNLSRQAQNFLGAVENLIRRQESIDISHLAHQPLQFEDSHSEEPQNNQ